MKELINKGWNMKKLLCAVLALAMIISLVYPGNIVLADTLSEPDSGGIHGSGSYQLNEVAEDYRFFTEYYVGAASGKSFKSAGIERRTTINVYAKAGEVILFGSSVSDSEIDENNKYTKKVTGADIVITTPTGKKIVEDVVATGKKDKDGNVWKRGLGYIANPTQEKYGPIVNHADENDSNYYVPIKYEVPVGGDGVYTFEFHSKTGFNDGSSPTKIKAGNTGWNQNKTTVAAWDVTVLGKNISKKAWEVKSGRAWADYLALTTGAGDAVSDLDVHVLTHDGYVYKVDFKKAAPFGFIFFANNTGFMKDVTDDNCENDMHVPIYHSFYDSSNDLDNMTAKENILLHKPNEADTDTEETYKIFFNEPSADLNGVTYTSNGNNVTLKTVPLKDVDITDLKFIGIKENIASSGHGGAFNFHSSGEAMIDITLDLRKAIFDSEQTMDEYEGSGIVEITAPAHEGDNTFYWDGKDTEGEVIPNGIYGNQNVIISTEIKHGEIHFPVIDMEGLGEGLEIKRLDASDDSAYNLYYNNNPLAYGTIEGKAYTKITNKDGYNELSDGTKSFNIATDKGGIKFFNVDDDSSISTLKRDDKEYLSEKLYNTEYNNLKPFQKEIIDAEYGKEYDSFHFEPVNSSKESMTFSISGYNGGGNQAGIDAWTYYSQKTEPITISFAVLDSTNMGVVRGQIFYDGNNNSKYDENKSDDFLLPNMKVRLIDKEGKPLEHEENMPSFDESGHFKYDSDGNIIHYKTKVNYEAITDADGKYCFTGVPYSTENDTDYYVQVMLTDTQSEVMRYTCTTSQKIKDTLKTTDDTAFINNDIGSDYGADGNGLTTERDNTRLYGFKYARKKIENETETIFDTSNAQKITFKKDEPHYEEGEEGICVETFKKIGYYTTVPTDNQMDYKLKIDWGTNSQGNATHEISDGLTVELWVWDDKAVEKQDSLMLSRRTGTLMDTQVLNSKNEWSHTWENLDNRLQYYVLEYYTKKKDNGEIIYNDNHKPRMVLIGGTMPIFDSVPEGKENYEFGKNLGDYPEKIETTTGSGIYVIPIQEFEAVERSAAKKHANSITNQEKLESVDNNARQYDVTYKLVKEGANTNVIYLTNSQVYDDRNYYVWLDHQTELPDFISQTYVENHEKKSHSLNLERDKPLEKGEYSIKGLSVSSLDAASKENVEGNATNAFRITSERTNDALFTASNHGNYMTGTGTRTYQVKYVVDAANRKPVSVKVNNRQLVLTENESIQVENNDEYIVYSWYMTIHVYNVEQDGIIEYDPKEGVVTLQEALPAGTNLEWKLEHDSSNTNAVKYTAIDDNRAKGLLTNDTYRVPLYKYAVNPDMGSCADVVGIAYSKDGVVSDAKASELYYYDTYDSRYGAVLCDVDLDADAESAADGKAEAEGSGGTVTVELNTTRNTIINRTQDHANYAKIYFTPKEHLDRANVVTPPEDVFYYKIVVFAEDSSYMFYGYDELDASEGVVMYAPFTMKSTALPELDPPGGGGNGGYSVPSKYKINIIDSTNGDVKGDKTEASMGEEVIITAIPDEGYEVDSVNVTDKNGKTIEVIGIGDGKYKFIMPDNEVDVDVSFKAVTDDSEEDTTNSDDSGKDTTNSDNSEEETEITDDSEEIDSLIMNSELKVWQQGKKIYVKWGKVADAEEYVINAGYCGKPIKKVKVVNHLDETTCSIKKLDGKKLNLKKNYKIQVIAYKLINGKKVIIGKTILAHIVGVKNPIHSYPKNIKIEKNKFILEVDETAKIKAKTFLADPSKIHLGDAHAPEFRYATTNSNVAAVSKEGEIKAISAGECTIYVYARNGYAKKVKVTVK